ncbi:MAG: hypothetical protein EXQ59_06735 [Acidobacteria bacterium]|nr:hypothetical protein [Acidobacteriota bacterium]
MKRTLIVTTFAAVVIFAAATAWAHHSFAAEFDAKAPITLKGTLTKLEWVNPHGWVHIDVKNPDGTVTSWAVETGGPNALLRRGVRQSDFKLGVEVVVEGYKAKSGKPVANGRTLKTADGRDYFLSASDAVN